MIYQAKALGMSYREIAKAVNVDPSTVCRTIALFDETGGVSKRKHPENVGTKKLTEVDKLTILAVVLEKPGIYLREIKRLLVEETGTEVEISTICKFLHESGFTRQKMVIAAQQRSDSLRAEYLMDMSVYKGHPEMFVFVDEMGSDKRDTMRKFAYSLRGKPAFSRKLLVRGKRVSAIAGISCAGLLDCYPVIGSVTADKFKHYAENALVPHLRPFNGVNAHSVVILDNASIHHVDGVVDTIRQTGALVQFLPPYSPDLNAIEESFSKVKSVLKANEDAWKDFDIETAVLAAFNSITPADCQAWIAHCGYE